MGNCRPGNEYHGYSYQQELSSALPAEDCGEDISSVGVMVLYCEHEFCVCFLHYLYVYPM